MKKKPRGTKFRNLIARGGMIYYRRQVEGRAIRFSGRTNGWDVAAILSGLFPSATPTTSRHEYNLRSSVPASMLQTIRDA